MRDTTWAGVQFSIEPVSGKDTWGREKAMFVLATRWHMNCGQDWEPSS